MKNNFFTIAIPCYKVNNEYFKECIDSIVEQSYQDFECLLLISDDTLDENLVPKDNRFKIITCEQHSTGFKRNQGIKQASGQYIIFVDCDDCIDKNYLKFSNDILKNGEFDIVYYQVTKERKILNTAEKVNFYKLTGEETLKYWIDKMLSIDDSKDPLWLFSGNHEKVYNVEFLKKNNLFINEDFGLIGEDKIHNFRCAIYQPKAAYANYYSYWWRTNNESFYRKQNSKTSLNWLPTYLKYIDEIFCNLEKYNLFVEKAKYQFIFYWVPKYIKQNSCGKLLKFKDSRYLIKSCLNRDSVLKTYFKCSRFSNSYLKDNIHRLIYFNVILLIKLNFYCLLNILLRFYTKSAYKKANKKKRR